MPQALVSGGKSRLPLYRKADSYVERCSLSVGDKLKGTVSGDFKIARSAVIRAPQQMLQSRLGLQRSVIELSVAVRMRSGFGGPGLSSLLSLDLGASLQLFTLQRPHWNMKTTTSFSPSCSVGRTLKSRLPETTAP